MSLVSESLKVERQTTSHLKKSIHLKKNYFYCQSPKITLLIRKCFGRIRNDQ